MNQMFPYILDASTYENKIFGLPLVVYTKGHLVYPRPQMEKVNWSLDMIQNVDDLNEFVEVWKSDVNTSVPVALNKTTVLDQFIYRYIYNHYDYNNYTIDLNDEAFKEVMTESKALYESDLVHDDIDDKNYVLKETIGRWSLNSEYLPMPQVNNQKDTNTARYYWYVINPNSKNIDKAVEFLMFFASTFSPILQIIFPQCCMRKFPNVAQPIHTHNRYKMVVTDIGNPL